MAWLERDKAPVSSGEDRKEVPEGLWMRCSECSEIVFRHDFAANQNVCPKCQHHFAVPARVRLGFFYDEGAFEEFDREMVSPDPLEFADDKPYARRLVDSRRKTGLGDAIVCARGSLFGRPIHAGAFDFGFMGGSMGSVVGEKLARMYLRAAERREPVVTFVHSGGARMQEGILSLMQMAKTCAALSKLREARVPYISVLANPTTGGVAASFAMLGDINIGEPGALIGFAGPRVIQQTIREKLPEGFQRAEYLLQHGMLDMICHRDALRPRVAELLSALAWKLEPPTGRR